MSVAKTLAVVGSRGFDDAWLMAWILDEILDRAKEAKGELRIVSGAARGTDAMAARWAKSRGVKCIEFPADWKAGKAAGLLRNQKIVESADAMVAFWDQVSPGTADSIKRAKRKGIKVCLIDYRKGRENWTHDDYKTSRDWSRRRRSVRALESESPASSTAGSE